MALLARILVVIVAFVIASFAAALVVTLAFAPLGWTDVTEEPAIRTSLAVTIGFATLFITAYAMIPALLFIALAEGFRLRSAVLYALAGGAIALFCAQGPGFGPALPGSIRSGLHDIAGSDVEIIAAAGIAAGLAYWLVAGRRAGAWRERRPRPGLPARSGPPSR